MHELFSSECPLRVNDKSVVSRFDMTGISKWQLQGSKSVGLCGRLANKWRGATWQCM